MAFHALSCRQAQRAVDAFADGELSRESTLATRAHLARCPACRCRARLQQALHEGTRRAVHAPTSVSPAFAHKVQIALAHERLQEESEGVRPTPRRTRFYWGLVVVVPWIALGVFATESPPTAPARSIAAHASAGSAANLGRIDAFVDQMIGQHAAPLPPTPSTEPFRQLEREVGLPVSAPPELARQGATWVAATSAALGNHRVASLSYRVAGRRCTLFLYDDARLPVRRSRYLSPKAVDERPVFVGVRRGYAFAAVERRGLGYAIATDLDVETAARLAASIR